MRKGGIVSLSKLGEVFFSSGEFFLGESSRGEYVEKITNLKKIPILKNRVVKKYQFEIEKILYLFKNHDLVHTFEKKYPIGMG